ncbi:hypothetical protein, partial [Klebsiella pneumoniae]|uniref:hypothetical protein n=1 Tax=Klebsiella pneumoniae TaxID=573 RepID=UPI0040558988
MIYMEATYPRDSTENDSPEDAWMRQTCQAPPGTDLLPPWDIWDLRIAIDKQKIGRAPGLDELDAAILKASCPLVEGRLLEIMNACLDRGEFN